MTTTNKQTAAIWAEKLGDAYVGCYGLLDDLDRENDVSNNGERESSLYRWMYNAQNGVLDISDEQKRQLTDAMKTDEQEYIPRNATESEFRNKCQDYKAYINSHYALPSVSTEPELYSWMVRSKANYNSFVDHRRKYLTDLFNYILSLGFSI